MTVIDAISAVPQHERCLHIATVPADGAQVAHR